MFKKSEKVLAQEFIKLVDNIKKATPIDLSESPAQKSERIKRLEADPEKWIMYYFPKYSFAKPAQFHIASTRRLVDYVKAMMIVGSGKFYQSRVWARGLSKSTRRMMEVFYIHYALKFPINGLLVSKSESNAIKLLSPYLANLEGNQRLHNDYGEQRNLGQWTANKFISKSNMGWQAVGADQNPRGSRNEEMRINVLIFDDADDDEVCRNKDRLDERWQWIEKAVMPTVEIAKPYIIAFDNNIIAEDSLAVRAQEKANDKEVINIRYADGLSTWPEKNTEQIIDDMLANISYESAQGEYFNSPMSSGKTFAEITWGECPKLEEMEFVVCYSDPAPSNRDLPGAKSGAGNSRKATFIVGKKGPRFYIYYGFLDIMSTARFVDGIFQCRDYISGKTTVYYEIENNTLQDPFYTQVLIREINEVGSRRGYIGVTPDRRKKPDKWVRIESTLEPINRGGNLIFNIAEKGNPHMLRLEAQFKNAKPTSKELDGPDCIQGAVIILQEKSSFSTVQPMFQYRIQSDSYHY